MSSAENSLELKLGSWYSPESGITIEYPRELLDEIRLTVSSSFHSNPRGGAEIGGVLFGTHTQTRVRIAAWRPISREHPYESPFALSEKDLEDLGFLLWSAPGDASGKQLEPVGWFVPHPRGGLELSETDVRVFDQFFPHPWQFTLVLQAALVGATRGEFFVRTPNGQVCEHTPDRELVIEPLHVARVHGRGSSIDATEPATTVDEPAVEPVPSRPRPRSNGTIDQYGDKHGEEHSVRPLRRVRSPFREISELVKITGFGWILLSGVAAIVIFAALATREHLMSDPRPATLMLRLQDWPGSQLHVDWSKDAQPIRTGRRGELTFDDAGAAQSTVELDQAHLRSGVFSFKRHSGNVKVKLSVYGDNTVAPMIEEVAEFTGGAPDEPAASNGGQREAWNKERADLEAEIKRLRKQLADERSHNKELENLVRVLENRLKLTPRN